MDFKVMTVCGITTYIDPLGKRVEVPQIWLHGKWLEDLCFTPGSYATVQGCKGLIKLELLKQVNSTI